MLANLDALIGFAVVMLGIALIVTLIVQGVSGALNLRGGALAAGLEELFRLAKVSRPDALAKGILQHPLISDSGFRHWKLDWFPWLKRQLGRWTLASAIRKAELVEMLQSAGKFSLEEQVSGSAPAVVATVETWFDAQMDRVSQVFAQRARMLTIFLSFVLALALHLDSIRLFQRFASNPELRAQVAATTGLMRERAEALKIGAPPAPSFAETELQQRSLQEVSDRLAQIQGTLTGFDLGLVPRFVPAGDADPAADKHSPGDMFWFGVSDPAKRHQARKHLLGILASAALLGLGAPFWFSLLKTLTNLRPILATKENNEREEAAKQAAKQVTKPAAP